MKKVLKRSLSFLLAITIIFGSVYVGISEVDFDSVFAVKAKAATSGNCGDRVYWSLSNNGVLTISGSGAMWDYNIMGDDDVDMARYPTYGFSGINKIIIGSGVTRIGNDAFWGFTSLETITIPDSVTSIGHNAFNGCTKLSSITIPDSVSSIGSYAFLGCTNLNITYFEGTEDQWNNISIGVRNDALLKNIVYGYKVPGTPRVEAVNTVNSVTVTWNQVDNAVKYNIYRRRAYTDTWLYLGTTTGTLFVDKSVDSYVSYAYSVRAYAANGLYSEYDANKTAVNFWVGTPTVVATNTTNSVQIKWNSVHSNYYKIYRRVGGSSSWSLIGTITTPSFVDKNVKIGTYYVYSVRAVITIFPSAYSPQHYDYISAFDTNKTDTIQPVTAPTAVATNLANGVQIKWTKATGATKYNVYRRVGGSSTWTLVGTTTGTSLVDKNVTNGKYYVYSIRAINGTGYSAFDTSKTDTIQPITAPTTKVAKKSNGVQVSWNKVTGATKYNVYRRLGGTSTWVYVGTTTGATFLDEGVVKGKYYAYSIRAINGTGYSAYNSSKCATIKYS